MCKYNKMIKINRSFFESGKTRNIPFRLEQLRKLKKAVEINEEEIIQSLKKDLRKPPFESYATEIGLVLTEIELFLKKLNSWARPERVKTSLMHFWSTSYIYKEPYGTVLVLSPWNYPFLLSLLPVVGAIAAGNTVVLKPSEYAPATSALLSKTINNTFSEGLITVIEGDKKISQALLQEEFDYIFFTGSRQVGKEIMKAAAENLTPVTLELGGKSPCIVDRDANIDLTARRIVWGKFLNAGQTCIAPDYLLLHKDIKEKLLVKATEYIRKFYGEKPELSPDYGRIVNERHFERLTGLLNRGKIITGGEVNKEELYISPTIIDGITREDPIMGEEIFGPLLPVMQFEKIKEVIKMVNNHPRPLALYVFSEDKEVQNRLLNEIRFGGGCINDTIIQIASSYLPFGGIGESGMGSYHGKTSFDTFTHRKSIIKKTNLFDLPLRYPPYKGKLNLLKKVFKWL